MRILCGKEVEYFIGAHHFAKSCGNYLQGCLMAFGVERGSSIPLP